MTWNGTAGTDGPWAEPCAARPLIGRERESALLHGLLSRHRLVTVTGPVGVGKSLLAVTALRARSRVTATALLLVRVPELAAFGSGAPWPGVPAPAAGGGRTAAQRLVAAVLAVLGGEAELDAAGEIGAALDAFTEAVSEPEHREPVLLLDDVDAVQAGALRLVALLLRRCPVLRVVVTARRPLGLGDERVLRLAPLPVRSGLGAPAVRLLLEHARTVRPGLVLDAAASAALVEICTALDGLPLALTHAARQLDSLEPVELAERLRERGRLGLGDPAADLPRHRTLRRALGTVEAQCDPRDRIVWSRVGMFAGSFTEESAAALCAGGGVDAEQVPACLVRLVAAGVLVPLGDPAGVRTARFGMSRLAAEFARERLAEAGGTTAAWDRLARHVVRIAATAGSLWDCGAQAQAVELVQDERPNLLAVLRRPAATPEQADALLPAVLDLWFWWVRHDPDEGRRLLGALLARCSGAEALVHRAQWLAVWLGARVEVGTVGLDPLGAAWAAALLADDRAGVGRIAFVQALAAWRDGDPEAAVRLLREAVELVPGYAPGGPSAATVLAVLALVEAEHAPRRARRSAWRAITWAGGSGDGWSCRLARHALALLDAHAGRPGPAARRARRMLAVQRPDLPTPPGTAALRRLAEAVAAQNVGVREGEGVEPSAASRSRRAGRVDARDAVPLPPPPGRPAAVRSEVCGALRDVAEERVGLRPAEQGRIGGAQRASRRN
ncbi:ATP-binding protein [Streptacidiphilus jiangxiensis]|uniref:ATP-binding protein n=2 Tax=Streptacidiphilus jiangxiensis TaxID=235985 RepID=UPI000942A394|nr:AAA family ATPase [Streptacidiphilus jiangxiensis]